MTHPPPARHSQGLQEDPAGDGAAKPEIPTDAASTITTPRAQAKALRAMTSLHRFAGRTHKYAAILFADLVAGPFLGAEGTQPPAAMKTVALSNILRLQVPSELGVFFGTQ